MDRIYCTADALFFVMIFMKQDDDSKEASAQQDASSSGNATAAAAAASAGAGSSATGEAAAVEAGGASGRGDGQVGLGAAVALSQAASGAMEIDEETKIMIRQTAQWFHANPIKSKVGFVGGGWRYCLIFLGGWSEDAIRQTTDGQVGDFALQLDQEQGGFVGGGGVALL